ncbi:hypothetical protein PVE99_30555 [Priestia megaterium]|uniref:Uncharacterized protein n=1 Tax=Priestia megaterium TaxID=1404 RepID=A0ABD4X2N1_PRIMG|nr:hypothetical protein [Priestia megaterium]MDD9786703.1 hypothetical protein [Priestia megaterium]
MCHINYSFLELIGSGVSGATSFCSYISYQNTVGMTAATAGLASENCKETVLMLI